MPQAACKFIARFRLPVLLLEWRLQPELLTSRHHIQSSRYSFAPLAKLKLSLRLCGDCAQCSGPGALALQRYHSSIGIAAGHCC